MPAYEYSSSEDGARSDDQFRPAGAGDDCDLYALSLTALFDGEASAEEEIMARLHLARCLRCARMWHSWSQTRGIWRATPAARVPSGLLLRILMACRLAALRKTPAAKKSRDVGETHAPLSSVIDVPPVPSHLRDAILQRTVGASVTDSIEEVLQPAGDSRTFSLLAKISMQQRGTRLQRPTRMSLPRWATAVAVPAGLMWLVAVSDQEPQSVPATLVSADSKLTMSRRDSRAGAASTRELITTAPPFRTRKSSPTSHQAAPRAVVSPQNEKLQTQGLSSANTDVSRAGEQFATPRSIAAMPHNQWSTGQFRAATSTQNERVWSDIPDSVERASFSSPAPGTDNRAMVEHTMLPLKSPSKPRLASAVWSVTPRVSQPARGRGVARVALRRSENSSREALLRASTRAMQSRLRASNPLSDLPTRDTLKVRPESPAGIPEASFVGDFTESDDAQRSSANDPDNLRNIVNEYRSTLLDEDEAVGASAASSAPINGTL